MQLFYCHDWCDTCLNKLDQSADSQGATELECDLDLSEVPA